MSVFDNYGERMKRDEKATRDRRIAAATRSMTNKFESDPSFFEVEALEPDGITQSVKKLKVINADYATHLNPARVNSRYFVGHPNTPILTGTVLFGLYDSEWMAISTANLTGILDRGMIQRVNTKAKWILDGAVAESFTVVSSVSRRSLGTETDDYMILPNDAVMFNFPKNPLTSTIKRDMRFMVGGMPYKITRIDSYTDPAMYYMVAEEDQLNPTDNRELGICDYVFPDSPVVTPGIKGEQYVSYGTVYQYTAIPPNGEVVVDWQVVERMDLVEKSFQTSVGFTLEVKNQRNIIGKQIQIQFTTDFGHTYTKVLTITSLL